MTDLSVIIVNYNVKEYLQNLLTSLGKAAEKLTVEIIVVDNASDDGSVEMLREKFPYVKLIANSENAGFGKANNQGAKIAIGKYLLLINPDTIVQEETLNKIFDFMERNEEIGISGCKVLNPDGTLQLACRRSFPGPWTSFTKITGLSGLFPRSKLFAKYNLTYLDENSSHEVDAVSGSFMFIRRDAFEKAGGFDESFFMYGEDLDLCYRVQQNGLKVFYFHETEIIHYKGESTKRSSLDETKIFYEAMKLFVKKHLSSSWLVRMILTLAISLRKFAAVFYSNKLLMLPLLADFILFLSAVIAGEKIYASERWRGFPIGQVPLIYLILAGYQSVVSLIAGVYRKKKISVLSLLAASVVGVLALTSFTFFFKQYGYSRAVVLIIYSLFIGAAVLWRIIAKLFFKIGVEGGAFNQRAVIVGESKSAINLAGKIKSSFTDPHSVLGLIGLTSGNIGRKLDGIPVVGYLGNISKVIDELKIRRIIFLPEEIDFTNMFTVVAASQGKNVEFMLAGDQHEFIVGKSSINIMNEIPLVQLHYNISAISQRFIKRTADLILSSLVLLFIFPFIYLPFKLGKGNSDLKNFILGIPSVFSGRKSFVGPKEHSLLNGLYLGKTGLTGLWFTERIGSGDSGEIKKVNLYYARNQNIWFDLEILGKSLSKMLDVN